MRRLVSILLAVCLLCALGAAAAENESNIIPYTGGFDPAVDLPGAISAAFTQLMGYGLGFIEAWWKRCVLSQDEFTAFEKNFYK